MTLMPSEKALVPFVSVENMMRIVADIGIEQTLIDLAKYIESDFLRWEEFERAPRLASHSADGVIELMPTADGQHFSFKYVNGHPKNFRTGHQTVTAFGVLSDVNTGYPVLLTEMTLLTALRTAATSALAARYLAPAKATRMAMIGNGAQCEFQALAFKAICGVDVVQLYDIDPAASHKAAQNLSQAGLKASVCGTPEEAILGAEIITTCTADKRNATILTDNMVGAGLHINAIGGDCPGKTELHADVLQRCEIFVEHPPQTRIEGEIQQLDPTHPVTELSTVISGNHQGRKSARETTLFDSVGFAIEDFSAMRFIRDRIDGMGFYDELDMLADPDDPRDLYGMFRRCACSD